FIAQHLEQLQSMFGSGNTVPEQRVARKEAKPGRELVKPRRFSEAPPRTPEAGTEIAIIGISGRYPQASNLEEFWGNLKSGKDCISEVPANRWDHGPFFDENKDALGKTYCKWGGFIDDVDQFDPLFFNISPREAEAMDPQQRLFLETV